MHWFIRAVILVYAALMLFLGTRALLAPAGLMIDFGLMATSADGTSAVRADMGGFFLGTGIAAVVGVVPGQHRWLLGAATMLAIALAGRIIGVTVEEPTQQIIQSMLVELVGVGLMLAGFWLIGKQRRHAVKAAAKKAEDKAAAKLAKAEAKTPAPAAETSDSPAQTS